MAWLVVAVISAPSDQQALAATYGWFKDTRRESDWALPSRIARRIVQRGRGYEVSSASISAASESIEMYVSTSLSVTKAVDAS